jgi:hypothetical protein
MNHERQLHRIQNVIDVIYALFIWHCFMLLPRPEGKDLAWANIGEMILAQRSDFVLAGIGFLVGTIYWMQGTRLMARMKQTDGVHTMLSVVYVVCFLLLMYAMRLGIDYDGDLDARVAQSLATALIGFAAFGGWLRVVRKREDLAPGVPEQEAKQLLDGTLAEPATALITIPFAYVGPVAWELSWFLYGVVALVLKKRRAWLAGPKDTPS